MKTITTFIIGLTAYILSMAVLYYSFNTFKYISTTFYNDGHTESYTFSFTFVLASIVSFLFAIILIITSIKYFALHRKYYHSYMINKRDREIKDKVESAKYNQLYEDLRDSPTVELKEVVLKTFYSTKDIAKQADWSRYKDMMTKQSSGYGPIETKQEDFDAMIESSLKEDLLRKKGLLAYMDEPTTAKPIRNIPTPHDLMGFELDDSTYSKNLKPTIDLLGFEDITFDKK